MTVVSLHPIQKITDTPPPIKFGFGAALDCLEMNFKVARDGWNGKGMWLALQCPDSGSKMTLPYIYMRTAQGDLVPWLASQSDVLSKDWVLVP